MAGYELVLNLYVWLVAELREWLDVRVGNFRQKNNYAEDGIDGTNRYAYCSVVDENKYSNLFYSFEVRANHFVKLFCLFCKINFL